MHFNKNKPENHNLLKTNKANDEVYVYTENEVEKNNNNDNNDDNDNNDNNEKLGKYELKQFNEL